MSTETKFASFNWMRGINSDKRIRHIYRTVLIQLLLRYQRDKTRRPGYDVIADELGVHRRTVLRSVDVGVKFGWLVSVRHGHMKNSFEFIFPVKKGASKCVQPDTLQCAQPDTTRAANVSSQTPYNVPGKKAKPLVSQGENGLKGHKVGHKKGGSISPTPYAPEKAAQEQRARADTPQQKAPTAPAAPEQSSAPEQEQSSLAAATFEQFWEVYPLHIAIGGARRAWERAVEHGVRPETMIEGAKRYARACAGKNQQHIANPKGWLMDERWDDDPVPKANGSPIIDNATGELVVVAPPRRNARCRTQSCVDEIISEMEIGHEQH
jgi:hypothetical protein